MNFLFRRTFVITREIECLFKCVHMSSLNRKKLYLKISQKVPPLLHRSLHEDSDHIDLDTIDDLPHLLHYNEMVQYQPVKDLLYANSTDPLIVKLTNSESVQEVLNTVKDNFNALECTHITQAVLVLWDLHKMYSFAHELSPTERLHSKIVTHPQFCSLMELAKEKCDSFDVESFSCLLLYATKLGWQLNSSSPQLFSKTQRILSTSKSLSVISRLLNVVRTEDSTMGSLFTVQPAVPTVLHELDICETLEDLKLLTICLQHFEQNITSEILQGYMKTVKRILSKSDVKPSAYRILLKIINFLNSPKWNDRCTTLSSEIILRMKNNLHTLNVYDLCVLLEALYKTHEPGELQTEMQRCCRMFLHSDDESNIPKETKVKLLSCMALFSATVHRLDYEKILSEYLNYPLSILGVLDLLRILTFVKSSNNELCEKFWNKLLEALKMNDLYKNIDVLLRVCQKYMNYNNDIHYRYIKFEKQLLNWLHEEFQNGILSVVPSKLSLAAAFVLAFESRRNLLNTVLDKVFQNVEQFNHLDCLYISKGIRNLDSSKNSSLSSDYLKRLNAALDNIVRNNTLPKNDLTQNNFLIKSCIYRRRFKSEIVNSVFFNFKMNEPLSSLSIRNLVIGLQTTGTLLPELMELLCNYVISYPDYILGFNAEKVAYLCYNLGYTPHNSDQLFSAIANIIIRDQERISGLSYIHAALALSFFNKLPTSWIKQIFNVSFLEKLDLELSMCYSKNKYPIRVRNSMMILNRAVCLDYPEANVPWFHKKYVQELKKDHTSTRNFPDVRHYLLHILKDSEKLVQDHQAAYGYQTDFLLHMDQSGQFATPDSESATKIAILLMKENAYTNINVQLKGYQQLKKRHLEILGYHVAIVNLKDWNSLLYGVEKVEFLRRLIYPSNVAGRAYYSSER